MLKQNVLYTPPKYNVSAQNTDNIKYVIKTSHTVSLDSFKRLRKNIMLLLKTFFLI